MVRDGRSVLEKGIEPPEKHEGQRLGTRDSRNKGGGLSGGGIVTTGSKEERVPVK